MKETPDFNPRAATKKLLREARTGALATLMRGSGDPYCSLVDVATAGDGSPVLLISTFAVHTKNLLADPRVSLMLDERKPGNPLEGGRIMLQGTIARTDDPADKRRYLARQPDAAKYAGFDDFAFYKMTITGAHYVFGFGRIGNLKARDILTKVDDACRLLNAEPEVIAHMNDDHAHTCGLYATRLLGAPEGEWRCVGCDPEGLDLQCGRLAVRLPFTRRMRSPIMMRKALIAYAHQARAATGGSDLNAAATVPAGPPAGANPHKQKDSSH